MSQWNKSGFILTGCNEYPFIQLITSNERLGKSGVINKLVKEATKLSFWKKLRKSFRYSIKIARDVIFNKKKPLTFDHHNETFIEVLKKFEFLKDKRIIVFYINGHQQKFSNFPSGKSKDFNNLEYIDLNIEEDTSSFYLIDGHLNSTGHKKVADKLSKLF